MSSEAAETLHDRGLLDTSVVIDLDGLASHRTPDLLAISTISLAELAAGPHATMDMVERARRQARLQEVEATMEAIPFDERCARAYGVIYSATVAQDRKPRGTRAVDLLIAAVALANKLPLYTRNPSDFDHLRSVGLDVIAV